MKTTLLTGLVVLLVLAPAPSQTTPVPCLNYAHISIPPYPGGVPMPPPGIPSCLLPSPLGPFPGVAISIDVETPFPGDRVMLFLVAGPCCPGLLCLPADFGLPIPPCLPPCGPATNQSYDLCALPAPILFVAAPKPPPFGPGGIVSIPFILPGPPFGVVISVQAAIFPSVPGFTVNPFIATNAYELIL